ncbi:hypothetical protein [Paraburkholderia bryophila]|uniref:Uncharacterized protein n=1 Tax=Paraburkholderia bryophila TaxID=420952 RepID=A0A329CUP4_9BURK|nr:hypothetical protein [Paraburkholderia bryophila]RAS38108.1 hypothetical protein BX591_102397 [Paraburkholderia bryophila]
MSTIPFTLIEGSMALPRMRPSGRYFPAPFGRDWVYRPPGYSWRTELKALYAAVVHTFCMSDQTFRSFCKWVPLMPEEPRQVIAGARTQPREEPAPSGHAPLDRATKFSVDVRSSGSARRPAVEAPSQRAPRHRNALAGGACALSGAALLAWIVLDHSPRPHAISEARPAKTTTVDRGAASTQSGPTDAFTARAASQAGSVSAQDMASSPVNAAVDSGNAQPLRSDETSGKTAMSAPALAEPLANESGHSALRHGEDFREKISGSHEEGRHGNAKPVASYKPAFATVRSDRVPGVAGSTIATQALRKPADIGSHAPFVPAQSDGGPYASVTMSTATPVRAMSPPPRPASPAEAPVASETEWMNHLSQRRVTDIPDQFSK